MVFKTTHPGTKAVRGRPTHQRPSTPIRAAGASLLYLPPYSPALNPIEQLFAKLKATLRSAASRTKDALWATIGRALDAFPEAECSNYLANLMVRPAKPVSATGRKVMDGSQMVAGRPTV